MRFTKTRNVDWLRELRAALRITQSCGAITKLHNATRNTRYISIFLRPLFPRQFPTKKHGDLRRKRYLEWPCLLATFRPRWNSTRVLIRRSESRWVTFGVKLDLVDQVESFRNDGKLLIRRWKSFSDSVDMDKGRRGRRWIFWMGTARRYATFISANRIADLSLGDMSVFNRDMIIQILYLGNVINAEQCCALALNFARLIVGCIEHGIIKTIFHYVIYFVNQRYSLQLRSDEYPCTFLTTDYFTPNGLR